MDSENIINQAKTSNVLTEVIIGLNVNTQDQDRRFHFHHYTCLTSDAHGATRQQPRHAGAERSMSASELDVTSRQPSEIIAVLHTSHFLGSK